MAHVEAEMLSLVAPHFRGEFLRFIETGDASPEFLDYLDHDERCQDAVELAVAEETQVIRQAIDFIRRELTDPAHEWVERPQPGRVRPRRSNS